MTYRTMLAAALVAFVGSWGAPAGAQTNTWTHFIQTAPQATTPLGATDLAPIIQGGVTKSYVPVGAGATGMLTSGVNAFQPDARNNILYTPAACDGFTASDGAASSNGFNSAAATFVASDVGKRIAIREAGHDWFVGSATVGSGGASHVVGQTVTYDNGFKAYVRAVSGGAITSIYVVDTGTSSSASPAATLNEVSALPTGGSGSTVTVTWLRQNHVTTVATFVDSHNITITTPVSATVTGAWWGMGTDYGTLWQTSIDAGIPVLLPSGNTAACGQASRVVYKDGTIFRGQGIGLSAGQSPTQIIWLGAYAEAQLVGDSDLNAGGARTSGAQVGGFELNGLGNTQKALRSSGVALSRYFPIKTTNHTAVGVQILATATQDNIMNVYEQFRIQENLSDLNTHGLWIGFPNSVDLGRDPDLSAYGLTTITTNTSGTGVPLLMGANDHNDFWKVRIQGNAAVAGAEFLGGTWSGSKGRTTDAHFFGLDAGAGGAVWTSTGYTSYPRVQIDNYDEANGAPPPVVGAHASADVKDNFGRQQWAKLLKTNFANLPTNQTDDLCPDGAIVYIGDATVSDAGAIVSVGGGTTDVFAICRATAWRVLQSTSLTTYLNLKPVAYASLPAGAVAGTVAAINDAPTAIWGDTFATGGGSYAVVAVFAGSSWRVMGPITGVTQNPTSVMFGAASLAAGTTTYLIPGASATATINDATQIVPVKGRLRNLRVRTQNPPGAGQSYIFTLNYGALAPTTVICTISGAVAQTCSDTTHDQAILVGGLWNVSVVTSGGASVTGVISIGMENNLE